MDEDSEEPTEPIFDLASECEQLFSEKVSRLKHIADPYDEKIVGEFQQRFGAWAAFLGVFAEPEMCLDRRLRRHPEIQDLILRLLDIMKRNLTFLLELDDGLNEQNVHTKDLNQHSLPQARINMESLRGIEGAIERLNHAGAAIQRSLVANQAVKARKFAERFDSSSFEGFAHLAINSFYPNASPTLLEQITQAMTEMYKTFHLKQYQQGKLHARTKTSLLSTIAEEQVPYVTKQTPEAYQPLLYPTQNTLIEQSYRPISPYRSDHIFQPSGISKITSVDSQKFKITHQQQKSGSIKSKTRSILINQIDYPHPLKGNLTCEWCFSPLSQEKFEGDNWKHHINEDFEPFICISDKCGKSLKKFSSSSMWFKHMCETHGKKWHREVHLPVSWVCPLCNSHDTTFSKPQDLSKHMSDCHNEVFGESPIQIIVQQSQLRSPRPHDICPLCCFSMNDKQEISLNEQAVETSLKNPLQDADDVDNHKRIKTYTGHTQPDQQKPTTKKQIVSHSQTRSAQTLSLEAVSKHVAAHLQGILLLTLRMISIDIVPDESSNDKSLFGSTNTGSSRMSSKQQFTEQETDMMHGLEIQDNDDVMDLDDSLVEDRVPDCDFEIDWEDVSRSDEPSSENDTFLQKIIDSGAFRANPSTDSMPPTTKEVNNTPGEQFQGKSSIFWLEAYELANLDTKRWIESLPHKNNALDDIAWVIEFTLAFIELETRIQCGNLRVEVNEKDDLLKNYIGPVRDLIAKVSTITEQFASAACGVIWSALWGLLLSKFPMQTFEEATAILGCTKQILSIIRRGKVYEFVFAEKNVSLQLPQDLKCKLITLYTRSLDMVALTAQRSASDYGQLANPEKATGLIRELVQCESDLAMAAQIYATANDNLDVVQRNLLIDLPSPKMSS